MKDDVSDLRVIAAFLGGRARLLAFAARIDARGALTPLAFDALPFEPRRSFFVHGVPAGTVRGGHSHRTARQLLFCVSGAIEVLMRHGDEQAAVTLDDCSQGLLIEAGVWAQQTYITPGAVLCALASEPFDPDCYQRDDAPR